MKKTAGWFLFLCLASPFLTSYGWFVFNRQEVRREAREEIARRDGDKPRVLLAFTQEEARRLLHWEKPWEFEFRGQMYDVVKTITTADSVYYTCHWDKRETSLNARVRELISKAFGHTPQNRENQKRLVSFLHLLYLQDHFTWRPEVPGVDRVLCIPDLNADPLDSPGPPVPPPRFI